MELKNVIEIFDDMHGTGGKRVFFSPGRINLIGEHLDYNGGNVLPAAIDKGIYFVIRKKEDATVSLCSLNMEDKTPHGFESAHHIDNNTASWLTYPKAVMAFLRDQNLEFPHGFDLLIWGSLPNSAGVSSSAALLVGLLHVFSEVYGFGFDNMQLAKYAQKVENDYVGLSCGIMDQFAVSFGKRDHAIFLNTDTLDYDYIAADLKDYRVVVLDSNKKRELIKSEYNNRKAECESALADIQKTFDVSALALTTSEQFDAVTFTSDIAKKRAQYVIEEQKRVENSCQMLKAGDLKGFAEEMKGSHIGLRDLYEVTGEELDALFDLSLKHGALGARMTGAGFGGCAIALVAQADVESFIEKVCKDYADIIGYPAKAFTVKLGDGVKELHSLKDVQ